MCEWMDQEKHDCAAVILCGDFNGAPHEPFHAVLRRRGYVSAHAARHGREPQASLSHCGMPCVTCIASRKHRGLLHGPLAQLPGRRCTAAVQGTWPTGIQAPLMDEGCFECLDFVYVWTAPGYTVE